MSVTDSEISNALKQTNGNASAAAALVGLSARQTRRRVQALRDGAQAPDALRLPVTSVTRDLPIDQLIERRIAEFQRVKGADETNAVTEVRVADDLPIGIVVFGDPHLDDSGTDLFTIREHSQIVNATPGMYAACIGDLHNNWVGRIAHLYSQQETTASDAWRLVEWWINYVEKWLFMVDGNHDGWSGASNPLPWIRALSGRQMVQDDHEVRVRLRFQNGTEYTIAARHEWPGKSAVNPALGEMKAAQRMRANLIVSGHTHSSLDANLWIEQHQMLTRCARVGSYKVIDRYAKELGLPNQQIAPAFAVIIDPRAKTQTGLSQLFYDIDRASRYLTFLRKEYTDVQPSISASDQLRSRA